MAACEDSGRTGLRESPAGSVGLEKLEIREGTLREVTKNGEFQCKDRDVDGESENTGDNENCDEEVEQQEEDGEKGIQRKAADEELDPRIQEARSSYRKILTDSARKLNTHSSQLGTSIEKARPYYEARRLAKEAQQETQKAALSYERAVSMHTAAREMVYVAEQGLAADKTLDQTWQEMLNHATAKVNEAEEERLRSEREHMRVTQLCQAAEARVQTLQKSLKRAIIKSKPYFELKAQFNCILEEHKLKVTELENRVTEVKKSYSITLRRLEKISEEIHAQRGVDYSEEGSRKAFDARSPPVGAEAVSSTRSEERLCVVHTKSNDWVDGKEGVTNKWVEMRKESCWWERDKELPASGEVAGSDSTSVVSFKTIASDLEKCDSIEHLGHMSDTVSLSGEEEEKGKARDSEKERIKQRMDKKLDISGKEKQEQFLKQHQRSVSL
ncbi:SH3-binding domain protein 5-like, a isoform X2 [Astyanax mexicanus]|uniref:SH3-binding domain protein 5-like, a isoform X2 n=1 Tax=Astyanax mexicanus TaxID=7994 RepID=UPI0020CB6682|nr:SH3-binding domain protein 5-like, a isoform X2 [Astyanax mexicanus]